MNAEERRKLGEELEGYAFTFCKAAFLATILRRYTLVGTAGAAIVLYTAAAAAGVRKWRCWAKPPWVIVAYGLILVDEIRRLRRG